jgi:hypothetical protein
MSFLKNLSLDVLILLALLCGLLSHCAACWGVDIDSHVRTTQEQHAQQQPTPAAPE